MESAAPTTKWTRLRGAALAIEAEIWRFRTRSGEYAIDDQASPVSTPEEVLRQRVEAIKKQSLKTSGVLDTYFMSFFEMFDTPKRAELFRHGQYEGCGVQGTFGASGYSCLRSKVASPGSAISVLKNGKQDDFHSPCRPDEYISIRVQAVLRHYQARLPRYYRTKQCFTLFLLVGSFSGAVLALFGLQTWSAIATAVVGAATAVNTPRIFASRFSITPT